jgi:hypothetical protein
MRCQYRDVNTFALKLEHCTAEVDAWMSSNRFKFNPEKTELMWFSTQHGLQKLVRPTIHARNIAINPVATTRSLVVISDEELKLASHVSTVCRSRYFEL